MVINKKRVTLGIVFILLVVIVATTVFSGGSNGLFETAVVERGNVVQVVSITGRVKAAESADLAFEKTGTVARILVDIGDSVYRGETLVTLSNADISAQLAQAQANVKVLTKSCSNG